MTEISRPVEYPKRRVDYLVQELGFTETPDVATLRTDAVDAMASGSEHSKEFSTAYLRAAEQLIEQQPREHKNRLSAALNITRALMYRDAGLTEDYTGCLYDLLDELDGLVMDGQEGYTHVVSALEAEIDTLTT